MICVKQIAYFPWTTIELLELFITFFIIQALCISPRSLQAAVQNSILFREYIGAQFNNVKFSDVPHQPRCWIPLHSSHAIHWTSHSLPCMNYKLLHGLQSSFKFLLQILNHFGSSLNGTSNNITNTEAIMRARWDGRESISVKSSGDARRLEKWRSESIADGTT